MSIHIEKFTSRDFDKYFQLVGNLQVMAMITERAIPEEEARKDFELILKNNELDRLYGTYKVFETSGGLFIGLAKLEIKEAGSTTAELGYMLLPEFWGQGFGGRVTQVLLEKAKSLARLKKVTAVIDPRNIPSRKILLKNGFISEKLGEIEGLPGEILSIDL